MKLLAKNRPCKNGFEHGALWGSGRAIILIGVFLVSLVNKGISDSLRFESLPRTTPLSDPRARAVHCDHLGQIWIGSGKGLSKYDGQSMKEFSPYRAPDSDPSNFKASAIHEDPLHRLWIAGANQLYMFDPDREQFQSFAHEKGSPSSTATGKIWPFREFSG